jgi:hypothetical protein
MKKANLLTFRGNPREKRTQKRKGDVVKFPAKQHVCRKVEGINLILVYGSTCGSTTFDLGKLPPNKVNELCAFVKSLKTS